MVTGLLAFDSPSVLYDIRKDSILLGQIRNASLSAGHFGLTTADGIVGSPEWWMAVARGDIKVEMFTGMIASVDGGPMGDSAIVRVQGDHELRSWTAWDGFDSRLIGKRIGLLYACVRPKNPPTSDYFVYLPLQIREIE